MKWIDFASPTSLPEAVGLLAEKGESATVLAGGTDLLAQLRGGVREADLVVDGKAIPELNEISVDGNGLTLGAAVPCYLIYNDPAIVASYPGLVDSASLIGGIQIQGRASIGGNLCNSAPSADAVPPLIALGATCRIAGPNGAREVAAEDFCTGPRQNVLERGELLVSLHFPAPRPNTGAHYMRFIPRNEMDIAVAGAGVWVELDESKSTFRSARIALASVAPTPLFVTEAGEAMVGKPVNDNTVQLASNMARDAARPINDMRGTIEYRRHLCEVLTRRALNIAIRRAKESS